MRVSTVRENLRTHLFDEDFAPEIRIKPAFRRAVKTTETEGKKITVCGRKDVKAQLDIIIENGSSIERQHEAFWRLDKEAETYTGPRVPLEDMRETYQYSDVSRVIRDVMKKDGVGSYALCPSGHIYAVPVGATDYLERLNAFVVACGLRFNVCEFDDSTSERTTISEALARSVRDELEVHSAAIAEYTAETKTGILRNRQGAVAETLFNRSPCSLPSSGRLCPLSGRAG